MSTTRFRNRGVLALALVALLSGYGLAAERDNATGRSSAGQDLSASVPQASEPSGIISMEGTSLKKASNVIGARVKSPNGETLGRIEDVVLTPDMDRVAYVALSRGGLLGIGANLHAVPWSALAEGVNGTFVLPITEDQLKQSRGFRATYWPGRPERGWTVRDEEPIYRGQTIDESQGVQDRRFTRMKGTVVRATDGANAGRINDLIIATEDGRIAYTVVSYGGLLGLGQRFAAVPHNAITLQPALNVARVDAPRETLRAHSFTGGQWPALGSPDYSQQVAQAFGVAPTGTVLGFVPPEQGPVAAAPATRPGQREGATSRATTPAPGTTAPATGMTPSGTRMEEPASAELMGTFNPASVSTIEGTVHETGKFKAAGAGPDMLWLRIRTTDGQTHLVNLGPRDYISGQDFYLVRGDHVRLTGSAVTAQAAGKRVFIPTEVVYNGNTLRLRSTTGTPLWEGQAATSPSAGQSPRSQIPSDTKSQASSDTRTPDSSVLGYAPPEERTAGRTARPGTPGSEAERPMTEFTPVDIIALGAFDLSSLRTLEGTVTEVGKSRAGGADVIWLRVRTMDGQTINIQVGPRDYVSRQNFFVVTGDRVRMNGWNARATGAPSPTPIFVLADITQDDYRLQLRNRNGEPLWTSSQQTATSETPGTRGTTSSTPTPDESGEEESDLSSEDEP